MKKYRREKYDPEYTKQTVEYAQGLIKAVVKHKSAYSFNALVDYTYQLLQEKHLSKYSHQEIFQNLFTPYLTIEESHKEKLFKIADFFFKSGDPYYYSAYCTLELKYPEVEKIVKLRLDNRYKEYLIDKIYADDYLEYLDKLKSLNAIPKKETEIQFFKKKLSNYRLRLLVEECRYTNFSEKEVRQIMAKDIIEFVTTKDKNVLNQNLQFLVIVPFVAKTLLIKKNLKKALLDFLEPEKEDILFKIRSDYRNINSLKSILIHYDMLNLHDEVQPDPKIKFINYHLAFDQIIDIYSQSDFLKAINHHNIIHYALDSRGKVNKIEEARVEIVDAPVKASKPKKL